MTSAPRESWYLSFEPLDHWGSGLATYYRHVVNAAKVVGREITIYQIAKGARAVARHRDGVVTHVLVPDAMSPLTEPLGYWMNLSRAMAEAVCEDLEHRQRPAAIEVPDGFALGYFLMQRKLVGDPHLHNIPIILVAHTPIQVIDRWNGQEVHSLPNWWTYRAEKWCYRAADAVVTLSSMLEVVLEEQGYILEGQVVRRGINPFYSTSSIASSPPPPTGNIVGVSSRMVNWKGLQRVLRLAAEARKSDNPLVIDMCGEGSPEFEKAKHDKADLFTSGTIQYRGCLNQKELTVLRSRWSCQIHPSRYDNFPYSVLEALSAGLPCLIGETNGIAEVLPGELRAALVCDFDKPADVLRRIEGIQSSAELVRSIAPKWIRNFDGKNYFEFRDALVDELASRIGRRTLFPFVDSAQARDGLRPHASPEVHDTGPRLTVVVPYFNMGDYIDECVASVVRSSIRADIIIVNDGSTDAKSLSALDKYRSRTGILVIDQANAGVATARNRGVEHASSEFVALLDADDTVDPTYYAKAISVLDNYDNVGFVGCWANDFEDHTNRTLRYWPTYNAEPMPNIVMNNTNCQALVYRRALYLESGRHDPTLNMYLDDWDGMLGMLDSGYFGVMLPEPLFNYRQRQNSLFSAGRVMWYPNFEYIVRKRHKLYRSNALEALLFSNANGPNQTYHLLGWSTPARTPSVAPSMLKTVLVGVWDALPKPIQRYVEPLADRIDRIIK